MKEVTFEEKKEKLIPANLTLVGVLHDPEGTTLPYTKEILPFLVNYFTKISVHTTTETASTLNDELRKYQKINSVANVPEIGENYRQSLRLALGSFGRYFFLVDLDRICYLAKNFPDEFVNAAIAVSQNDFIMFKRTSRAFRSHPQFQRETEKEINKVACEITGIDNLDILSGAYGMSRKVAEFFLEYSKATDYSIWSELFMFPYKLLGKDGVKIFEVDGLAYEERQRFPQLTRGEFLKKLANDSKNYEKRSTYVVQITSRLKLLANQEVSLEQ